MKTRAAILDAVNTPLEVEEVELIVPIGRRCLCAAARGEEHNLTNRLPRYIQDTILAAVRGKVSAQVAYQSEGGKNGAEDLYTGKRARCGVRGGFGLTLGRHQ